MKTKTKIGTHYEFCSSYSRCLIAIEIKIGDKSGLEIKNDFNGSVKLTDGNFRDLAKLLIKRLNIKA